MAIQILHYEFMGPIRLDEWGPPMEEVVYVLLGMDNERFSLIYADHCAKSDDAGFFTKNPRFKCWVRHARSERNLHVAVYPMFGSSPRSRQHAVDKIVSKYRPACNAEPAPQERGAESGRTGRGSARPVRCACCGADMELERQLEKSDLYRCAGCGISDTRLK